MSPPRRQTRSNTKAMEDIPLPPTRKPPKARAKSNKNVQDSEDRGPREQNRSGRSVQDQPSNPPKVPAKKGKVAPTGQPAEELNSVDRPDQEGSNKASDHEDTRINKSPSAINVRPKPVLRKDPVPNLDDDSSFLSARRGWRRSPPPVPQRTDESATSKTTRTEDNGAAGGMQNPHLEVETEEQHPENDKEQPDTPPASPTRSRSSSPSGSDYEAEQRKLQALRPPTSRRRRSLTMEEQDQEDEDIFEHDIAAQSRQPTRPVDPSGSDDSSDEDVSQGKKGKGKQAHLKAKGKANDSALRRKEAEREDSEKDEDGDEDEDVTAKKKKYTKPRGGRANGSTSRREEVADELSEKDSDEDEDEDEDVIAAKKKKHTKRRTKGKGRAAEGDQSDGEDVADASFKPGPIPEAAKNAVFIAHADYQCRMQDIANEYKKPVNALYQLVGQALPVPRFTINGWNAFQVWYGINGDETKPKTTSSAEWTKVLVKKYEEYLKDKLGDDWEDQQARAECLKPLIEWYKERLGDHVENMKVDGHCKKMLLSTTDKFIQYSTQAYEMYGIHVFGFAINTQRDEFGISHSTSWGGSPAFAALRQSHKASISTQLNDYEAMFRVEEMKAKGLDVAHEIFTQTSRKEDELGRDYERRAFKGGLVSDYGKILMSRGKLSAAEAKNLKMPWAGWADAAFESRVCLINWPRGARAPGRGFDIKSPDSIPQSVIRECIHLRRQAEDDDMVTDYVKIVPWSDEDLLLEIEDIAINDVPLVVNASEKKKKEQQRVKSRAGAKTRKRKNMPANVSSDEDDVQRKPPPLKKQRQVEESQRRTSRGGNVSDDNDSIQEVVPMGKKQRIADTSTKTSRQRKSNDAGEEVQDTRQPTKKRRDIDITSRASRHVEADDDEETRRTTRPMPPPKHVPPPPDPATLERWARENGWTREISRSRKPPQHSRSTDNSDDETLQEQWDRSPSPVRRQRRHMGEFQNFYTGDDGYSAPKMNTANPQFRESSRLPRSKVRDPVAGPSRAPNSREHTGPSRDPRARDHNAAAGPSRLPCSPTSRPRDHYQGRYDAEAEYY
ncbi:hypothetical protein Hypma_003284 [Hypsizygus marmoreus]|uniref:Uncharacterized protein n=1 Tax=Hypsizygus marmoreus TaxID=39966 RepID=A0A369JZD2_HYPMA|nr:hypothetical protein Hypma_003284 [Hypsizygus marmoreus]